MNRLFIIVTLVMSLYFMLSAQTTIPIPLEIVSSSTYLRQSEGIGDYDGDGVKDIAVWWDNIGSTANRAFSIYSYKAKQHVLVVQDLPLGIPNGSFCVDLDGDGKLEIIILDKIYTYTVTDTKKKAQ